MNIFYYKGLVCPQNDQLNYDLNSFMDYVINMNKPILRNRKSLLQLSLAPECSTRSKSEK